jgi:uncharacterized protein (DUF1697 family)
METYVSMLRGINLGKRQVPMDGLKDLYQKLKYKGILTYIQSGNVIFRTGKKKPEQSMIAEIEKAILTKYGFEVPVIIRTRDEMEKIVRINPMLEKKGIQLDKLQVTFLAENPPTELAEQIDTRDYTPDEWKIMGREIYLYCPNGYGITKLSNNFFEKKLKTKATTRNWKTVHALVEMSRL